MTYNTDNIPEGHKHSIPCDVCGELILHPKTDCPHELRRFLSNELFLGNDYVLCWFCYLQWYSELRTDIEEIKQHSIADRKRWFMALDTMEVTD